MKLKQLIKRANKTNKAIAEELGVNESTVWRWEQGKTLPSAKILKRLAKVLSCKMDDLLKEPA